MDKIVATFAKYKSVPTYAYRATAKEIAGNDYNMNIPRYVETSEAEEEIDIIAVQREIDGLESDLAKTRAEIRKHLKELGL
ncbi:MAG: N-6 DNA methylase [Isosphaeraceae bacterium]